ADRSSSAQVRAAVSSPTGHDPQLWQLVTELGLPGIAVPEVHGGTGGTFVDAAVVLEEAGRSLLPVPLLPTVVAAAAARDADLGAAVARGAVATLAVGDPAGEIRHVLDGHLAEWLVVAAPTGLWLGRVAEARSVDPVTTLDPVRRQATVRVDAERLRAVGDIAAGERAVDLLRVAL